MNYTTVETMDEKSIDLGFLGLKMVLTADIFMFFEETKTHYYQLFYESVKLVRLGSVIHSDEWAAYRCLKDNGYIHNTVNHQQNYVDQLTKAHTQSIERSWLDAKTKIMKTMRGTTMQLLKSHLYHYCWKVARKEEPDLFIAFLRDIKAVYR